MLARKTLSSVIRLIPSVFFRSCALFLHSILKIVYLDVLWFENQDMCLLLAHGDVRLSLPDEDGISRVQDMAFALHLDDELPVKDIEEFVPVVGVEPVSSLESGHAKIVVVHKEKGFLCEVL